MKKSYLMIAAAAALFVACAGNDVINEVVDEEIAIGFEGKYVNKETRAEITQSWFSNADENHFGVYGYKGDFQLFNNEDVKWNNTNNDWTHSTVRFWDKSATNYNFYAYAPYNATHTFTNKKFSFTTVPVIKDITLDNADIAIATPITAMSYGNCTHIDPAVAGHGEGHVEFDFNHILSKLAFKVKTSVDPTVAEIKVTALQIDFPQGTATWTQNAANAVIGTTAFPTYTVKDGTDYETSVFSGKTAALTNEGAALVDATTATNVGKTFIVAPVTGAETGNGSEHIFGLKVTYDIQYKKNGANDGDPEVGCIATGIIGGGETTATQYKPTQNSSYVITIDVNPAQIQFCVDEVVSWQNDTPREVEVK